THLPCDVYDLPVVERGDHRRGAFALARLEPLDDTVRGAFVVDAEQVVVLVAQPQRGGLVGGAGVALVVARPHVSVAVGREAGQRGVDTLAGDVRWQRRA